MAHMSSLAFPFLFIILFAFCVLHSVDCRDGKLLSEAKIQGTGSGEASASCRVSSSGSGSQRSVSKGGSSASVNCSTSGNGGRGH